MPLELLAIIGIIFGVFGFAKGINTAKNKIKS